jgi:hypothetical protein
MAKKKFTFESNLPQIKEKIAEKPYRVLNVIGANIVKTIRPTLTGYYKDRKGRRLSRSLGYWARKQERDLQIGFKMFYGPFVMDHDNNPLTPAIRQHKDEIVKLIGEALDQIRKE